MPRSGRLASVVLSVLMFALFIAIWHGATMPSGGGQAADSEYSLVLSMREDDFDAASLDVNLVDGTG